MKRSLSEILEYERNGAGLRALNESFKSSILTSIFDKLDNCINSDTLRSPGYRYNRDYCNAFIQKVSDAYIHKDYADIVSSLLDMNKIREEQEQEIVDLNISKIDYFKQNFEEESENQEKKSIQYLKQHYGGSRYDIHLISKKVKLEIMRNFYQYFTYQDDEEKRAKFNIAEIEDSDFDITASFDDLKSRRSSPILCLDSEGRIRFIVKGTRCSKINYDSDISNVPKADVVDIDVLNDRHLPMRDSLLSKLADPNLSTDEKSSIYKALNDTSSDLYKELYDYFYKCTYLWDRSVKVPDILKKHKETKDYTFIELEENLKINDERYNIESCSKFIQLAKKNEKKFVDKEKYTSRKEWEELLRNERNMAKRNIERYSLTIKQNSITNAGFSKFESDVTYLMSLYGEVIRDMTDYVKSLLDEKSTAYKNMHQKTKSSDNSSADSLDFYNKYHLESSRYSGASEGYKRRELLEDLKDSIKTINKGIENLFKIYNSCKNFIEKKDDIEYVKNHTNDIKYMMRSVEESIDLLAINVQHIIYLDNIVNGCFSSYKSTSKALNVKAFYQSSDMLKFLKKIAKDR